MFHGHRSADGDRLLSLRERLPRGDGGLFPADGFQEGRAGERLSHLFRGQPHRRIAVCRDERQPVHLFSALPLGRHAHDEQLCRRLPERWLGVWEVVRGGRSHDGRGWFPSWHQRGGKLLALSGIRQGQHHLLQHAKRLRGTLKRMDGLCNCRVQLSIDDLHVSDELSEHLRVSRQVSGICRRHELFDYVVPRRTDRDVERLGPGT